MLNYSSIKVGLLFFLIALSQAQLTDDQYASQLSTSYTQLQQQLTSLKQQSLAITNGIKCTPAYTATLNSIQNTISAITQQAGEKGSILNKVVHLYKVFGLQNQQTKNALNALKTSLNNLAGQINNVKRDILNQINLLNRNSAMRNIDSSVTLLQSLIEAYQSTVPVDFYIYQQLCGDYLNNCNIAFVVVAEGLSDYITSIKIESGWSRTEVLTQYAIHNSLLISSLPILFDLNTQLVIKMKNLDPATLTDAQKQFFSQSSILFTSYQRSFTRLQEIIPQLYDTYYPNFYIQTTTYNDLTNSKNSLLIGIYRGISGDQFQAVIQSRVGQKDITLSSYLIKSEWSNLDNNDTWHNCPPHSFLRGFYLNDEYKLHHVEELVCNTYQNLYHDKCQSVDIPGFAATNQWALCNDGSFIVGFYRGNGGDNISNISKLMCCSVTTKKPSSLSYLDSLTIVNTSYKPSSGTVDYTGGSKGLVSYFTINGYLLQGNFQVGVRNGLSVASTSVVDVLTTFDNPNQQGQCGQDSFLWGFNQNNGNAFSHIEKLQCVKYQNTYWEYCTSQVISDNDNYWKCRNASEYKASNTTPSIARCAAGSFLVGLRRNDANSMQGLDRIVCCTITNTPGLYKSRL